MAGQRVGDGRFCLNLTSSVAYTIPEAIGTLVGSNSQGPISLHAKVLNLFSPNYYCEFVQTGPNYFHRRSLTFEFLKASLRWQKPVKKLT